MYLVLHFRYDYFKNLKILHLFIKHENSLTSSLPNIIEKIIISHFPKKSKSENFHEQDEFFLLS